MDYNTQAAIVAFVVNIFLSIYMLVKRYGWRSNLNRNFAYLSLSFAIWNLGFILDAKPVLHMGLYFSAPALFEFLRSLLRLRDTEYRKMSILAWATCILCIVVEYQFPSQSPIYDVLAVLTIAPYSIWGALHLFDRIRFAHSRQERLRLWYVFIGLLIASIFGLTSLGATLGLPVYPLGTTGGLIYTLLITIAIRRHRMLDFGNLAGRIIVIFIFTFLFWILFGVLGNWYVDVPYISFLSILMASLVLIALYEPLTALVEGQADRVLGHASYQFTKDLQRFSREIGSLVTESSVIRRFSALLRDSERLAAFAIYIVDPGTGDLVLRDGDDIRWPVGTVVNHPQLLEDILIHRQAMVNRNDIAREVRSGLPELLHKRRMELYREMFRMRAQICMPFIFAESFLGFLALSFKDPESDITHRETETLTGVCRQFAASLAHARVSERERAKDHLAALGQLASGLAHEIRNPLATIKAATDYLQPEELNESNREFFYMIRDEVQRINRFVERFLSYARPAPLDDGMKHAPLGPLIRRIMMNFQAQNRLEGIQVEIQISKAAAAVPVPEDPWSQIMINLVDNAIQVLNGNGRIRVQAKIDPRSGNLMVVVEDSGPGITSPDFDQIFQPFYTTREKGTGLGLAIVRQLVEHLNGRISAGRSSLSGARLEVIQPVPELAAPDDSAGTPAAADTQTGPGGRQE